MLLRGQQNRHTAATNMNRESSRSHSVFTCVVECKTTDEAGLITMLSARVNLVDLAGTSPCSALPVVCAHLGYCRVYKYRAQVFLLCNLCVTPLWSQQKVMSQDNGLLRVAAGRECAQASF